MSELAERRAVRALGFAGLVILSVLAWNSDDGDDQPLIAYGVTVLAVVGIAEVVRPGAWRDWRYDHPLGSVVAIAALFAGLALSSGQPVWWVAVMAGLGAVIAVAGRSGLERRVQRDRALGDGDSAI